MLNDFVSGIISGILISLGGAVFLACDNRIAAAVLFSVALFCICMFKYYLYTGKVCFMIQDHSGTAFRRLFLCLVGNFVGTLCPALLLAYAIPGLQQTAQTVACAKLTQLPLQTFVRGIFCGILIYLAVAVFAQNKNSLGILLCIPTFILSGYEHSIADMFYFSTAQAFTPQVLIFILIVIAGNSVGGLLLPFLRLALREE